VAGIWTAPSLFWAKRGLARHIMAKQMIVNLRLIIQIFLGQIYNY
jgi:hypothetical protein